MNLERVKEELGESLKLGSLPKLTERLRWTLKAKEVDFDRVIEVALLDPPFIARLLRSVNCGTFGLDNPVYDPYQAATILGVNGVTNLIGRTVVLPDRCLKVEGGLDLRETWRKSVLMARLTAELFPRVEGFPKVPKLGAYALGLLADIGQYTLMACLDTRWPLICLAAEEADSTVVAFEYEELGFCHTDLGAMLAARYELPDEFVRATRFHHNERRMAESDPLAGLIALTDILADLTLKASRRTLRGSLPQGVRKCVGFELEDLDDLASMARRLADDINI